MSEWKGQYVRCVKVAAQEDPVVSTPLWDEYKLGYENPGMSIPLSYWLEGYVVLDPTVGRSLIIDRRVRNGEVVRGVLQTSNVTAIHETPDGQLKVETNNSVYMLSKVPEREQENGTHQAN